MAKASEDYRPVIAWLILVYDKTAEVRFPFKRKWYNFNYEKATEEETATVLRLINARKSCDPKNEVDLVGQWQITMSVGGEDDYTSAEILGFRHLFEPVEEKALGPMTQQMHGFACVNPPTNEYFEDERGQRISLMEVFDCEAKRKGSSQSRAIVLNIPESILRIGPVNPIRGELWSQEDANLLAQYFRNYRFLANSRWLGTKCQVTPKKTGRDEALLPLEEDCRSVVLPFRQLYSSDRMDDLFNKACGIHNRHCPAECSHVWWVGHYRKFFNDFLNGEPKMFGVKAPFSARRYLDAFAYGAGVIHAKSKDATAQEDFNTIMQANSEEVAIFNYHFILHTLLGYVSLTIPVMRQNFYHWTEQLGWAKPNRPEDSSVFAPSQ